MHLTQVNTITNFIKPYHVLLQNHWYLVGIHTYLVKYLPIRRIFFKFIRSVCIFTSQISLLSNRFRDVLFKNVLNTGIKD